MFNQLVARALASTAEKPERHAAVLRLRERRAQNGRSSEPGSSTEMSMGC